MDYAGGPVCFTRQTIIIGQLLLVEQQFHRLPNARRVQIAVQVTSRAAVR